MTIRGRCRQGRSDIPHFSANCCCPPAKKDGILTKLRDSGTTMKYSQWHFPAEKSVDFPPWGLLTFAGNPVICAVKRRFPHPGSGENYRRIL